MKYNIFKDKTGKLYLVQGRYVLNGGYRLPVIDGKLSDPTQKYTLEFVEEVHCGMEDYEEILRPYRAR